MDKDIKWKQLLSLAALYASVIIGWIAYYNYQPKLLQAFGMQNLTLNLYIAQGIILSITPLIAGKLGDRFRKTRGKRLPIITAGISLAAMIFMSVAFTLVINPGPSFYWILPVLIIIWIFSMSIFTSPAISTVELFAPSKDLPIAMAVITVVSGLLYALEPIIVDLVDYLGATLTFIVGGVAVAGSGYLLNKNIKGELDIIVPEKEENKPSNYYYPLLLGLAFGIATTVLFNMFPEWLESSAHIISGNVYVSICLALSAIISVILSFKFNTHNLLKLFVRGISICIVGIIGIYIIKDTSQIFITLSFCNRLCNYINFRLALCLVFHQF